MRRQGKEYLELRRKWCDQPSKKRREVRTLLELRLNENEWKHQMIEVIVNEKE